MRSSINSWCSSAESYADLPREVLNNRNYDEIDTVNFYSVIKKLEGGLEENVTGFKAAGAALARITCPQRLPVGDSFGIRFGDAVLPW